MKTSIEMGGVTPQATREIPQIIDRLEMLTSVMQATNGKLAALADSLHGDIDTKETADMPSAGGGAGDMGQLHVWLDSLERAIRSVGDQAERLQRL